MWAGAGLIPLTVHANALGMPSYEWETSLRVEGASTTLPVMALGKSNWPDLYQSTNQYAHAWQSLRFDLGVTTKEGWQIGYLARYEASLHANHDTVAIAALIEKERDPMAAQKFNVDLNSKTWRGEGLSLTTPWRNLTASERVKYKAQGQLLSLQSFNTKSASGWIDYTADQSYDFNVSSNQNSHKKTSQFGQAPNANGWGTSLSLSLRYDYDAGSHIEFQGHDLISQLNWRLLNEQSTLNSKQKITFTDGSVDFTPMVSGRYQSIVAKDRIDPDIRLRWAKATATHSKMLGDGQLVLDYRNHSSISQYWVGWASQSYHDIGVAPKSVQYKVSADALNKAVRMEWRFNNAFMAIGGDRFGQDAKQKIFQLGWRSYF